MARVLPSVPAHCLCLKPPRFSLKAVPCGLSVPPVKRNYLRVTYKEGKGKAAGDNGCPPGSAGRAVIYVCGPGPGTEWPRCAWRCEACSRQEADAVI